MSDIYKIAVQLTMASNAPAFLQMLSGKLLGVHAKVKDLEGGFNRLHAAIAGGAAVVGGGAILGGIMKIADKGEELLDQQNQLIRLGIGHNEVLRLTNDYWSKIAKNIPTSTAAEFLATVKELRAVTGGTESAEAFAPRALKLDALLSNISGKKMHGELYKILRAGEMKGIATDLAKMDQLGDLSYRYLSAFGGKLTSNMIQNLANRGGTAWMNADLNKSFGPMAVLAAEMGSSGSSSSPGVVLYQLQQLMMGANTLSKQQYEVFDKLHLIDHNKVKWTGFGHSKAQLEPGAMKGSLQYAGDVPGWARDIVWPALVAASHGDEKLLQNYLSKIAPTTNKAKAIELFGNPEFVKQMMKDMGLAQQVMDQNSAYNSFTKDDPKGTKEAFHNQYESMMSAIGAPVMQAALPVMKAVTSMFTAIGQFANVNPDAIKSIAVGVAVLGAALVGGGLALLAAAIGPVGWLTAGIVALGAALAVYNPGWMKGVADGLRNLWDSLHYKTNDSQNGAIVTNVHNVLDDLFSIFKSLGDISLHVGVIALKAFFSPVINFFSALASLASMGKMDLNLASVGDFAKWLAKIEPSITKYIDAIPDKISAEIATWPGRVASAIAGMGNAIVNKLLNIFHLGSGSGTTFSPASGVHVPDQFGAAPDDHIRLKKLDSYVGSPKSGNNLIRIDNHVHLDGRQISHTVTKYQARANEFPAGVHGMPDTYASFVGPGSTYQPT
jgi:hypothetical protein